MADQFREKLGPRRSANLTNTWKTLLDDIDSWILELSKVATGEATYLPIFAVIAECLSICGQHAAGKIRVLRMKALEELLVHEPDKEMEDLPRNSLDDLQSLLKEAESHAMAASTDFMVEGSSDILADLKKKLANIKDLASKEIAQDARALSRPATPDGERSCLKRSLLSPPSLPRPSKRRSTER